MNVDYVKTKVDFYKSYTDDYENFFTKEVEPSNQVITSDNSPEELQRKVRDIRKAFQDMQQSLQSNWEDSVEKQFSGYLTSCDTYLGKVEDSIDSNLKSAEDCYKKLDTLLTTLKEQNTAYQSKYDSIPNINDSIYIEIVPAGYDKKGVYHKSYTKRKEDDYLSDYNQWQDDVKSLGGDCVDTIAQIELLMTNLSNINRNVLSGPETTSGVSSIAPTFEFDGILYKDKTSLGLTGTVKEYIEKNNLQYFVVNRGGKDYYVLANISSTTRQSHDKCLAYANAYAEAITELNGYDVSKNGTKYGTPYLYSSTNPNEIYQIAASEYVNGRASVIEVLGSVSDNTRHFVAIAGFAADADFSNLKPSDILILDPMSSSTVGYKVLGADISGQGQRRDLTSARTMKNNSFNTDFAINVFGNADYAGELENTRLVTTGATQEGAKSSVIKFANA